MWRCAHRRPVAGGQVAIPAQRSVDSVCGDEIRVCQDTSPCAGVGNVSGGVVCVYVEGRIVGFGLGVILVFNRYR